MLALGTVGGAECFVQDVNQGRVTSILESDIYRLDHTIQQYHYEITYAPETGIRKPPATRAAYPSRPFPKFRFGEMRNLIGKK